MPSLSKARDPNPKALMHLSVEGTANAFIFFGIDIMVSCI